MWTPSKRKAHNQNIEHYCQRNKGCVRIGQTFPKDTSKGLLKLKSSKKSLYTFVRNFCPIYCNDTFSIWHKAHTQTQTFAESQTHNFIYIIHFCSNNRLDSLKTRFHFYATFFTIISKRKLQKKNDLKSKERYSILYDKINTNYIDLLFGLLFRVKTWEWVVFDWTQQSSLAT